MADVTRRYALAMTDQAPSEVQESAPANVALIIAGVWAAAALIVGIFFIASTPDIAYGGDAYSGIQAAAAQTARAVGWLIIGSGALGLIIATSRPRK